MMEQPQVGDVAVYASGLVHLSACAPASMSAGEVTAAVNTSNPTGISSRWRIDPEGIFADGQANPCQCDQMPDERTHYLLAC
jgi:hypothetical protein